MILMKLLGTVGTYIVLFCITIAAIVLITQGSGSEAFLTAVREGLTQIKETLIRFIFIEEDAEEPEVSEQPKKHSAKSKEQAPEVKAVKSEDEPVRVKDRKETVAESKKESVFNRLKNFFVSKENTEQTKEKQVSQVREPYRASEYVIIPKEKPVILNSLAEIHKALDEQEPRVGLSPREPVKTEPYLIADSVDDFQQLLDKRQVPYTMKTMDASGTDRFMKERSEKQAAMDMKLKKEEAVHTAETMKKAEKKAEPVKEESKVEPQKPSKEKQDIPKQVEEVPELFPQEPEITGYQLPSIELLDVNTHTGGGQNRNDVMANVERLEKTLHDFGVKGKIADVSCGPAITQYEFQPAAGVKVSKIVNLSDDIALSMAVAGVRIEAPIPGKAAVGIEIPNKSTTMVGLRELIESDAFQNSKSKLTVALGKDISGNAIVADLAKMPHLLIAGSTGSGKSVCINTLINSILYKATPDEVKFVMVDPKKVELGNYNGIPHLISPVVTDAKKAAAALRWAVHEMDRRYEVFANAGVKDMPRFNKLSEERMAAAQTEEEKEAIEIMPYIVVLIDELADLMMVAPADVEDAICRLAQLARAAGIHLVVATQRPSVDVITGIIKANMPSRIAFAVSSQTDSRTILDMGGAEKLLGRGDMLFYPTGMPKPQRVQGVYVSDGEIERITDAVKNQAQPVYNEEIGTAVVNTETSGDQEEEWDDLIPEATKLFIENGQASISLLQRRFRVGYTGAARIVDQMEQRGLVGPYEGSKPRQIKVTIARYNEMIENGEL
ncbi:MAG: DNA translocase FtsK [Peptococcaceae bacterium]|nr:DNA translocase FtsK [Peptococcaceae bacterium]